MTLQAQRETIGFQTEVAQLMHLVVHSLYSNKEIFLRELISNASDAADKLRFEALANSALYEGDGELKIKVSFDADAKTITVTDNGIGMTRDEAIMNLGTIAKSGTREFLSKLTQDQKKDASLIGQFGVGFYSAFIVAEKVVVNSRKAGTNADQGVRWESNGSGEYTVENIEKQDHGTEIILHIKESETEFLDDWRLRSVITKYSDHIGLPILMKKIETPAAEGEEKKEATQPEWETVNRATALWTVPKSDIKDDEYKAFYKHIAHDFEDPLLWSHNRVEGKTQYISLLYIPARAPFDLYQRDHQRGLKLYVQRVFIMDNAEHFLPGYLRFIKGVIDSSDLPLNVSREILQNNRISDSIRQGISKRVLEMLEKLSSDKEEYAKFWQQFGKVLKEGPAEDFANKEKIASLLRFATTHLDTQEECVSLDEYVSRMKPEQDKIYYITADTFDAAKHSPHLEIFRKKGIEVLLLKDRIDEWLVSYLTAYQEKELVSVARGDLDLGKLEDEAEKTEQKAAEADFASTIKQMKEVLGGSVKEVRLTHRLTSSPACIVADSTDINANMQRILQSLGQEVPETQPILEVNPEHQLLLRLKAITDDELFSEWTHILFDQAILAEGGQLKHPAEFVRRLNKLLMQ